MLVRITNTLTLVRLWWAVTANIRRRLANCLLVYTFNDNFCLCRRFNRYTFWTFVVHRV